MELILNNNSGFKWHKDCNIWVKGYLINKEKNLFRGKELIGYFRGVRNEEDLLERIGGGNGNFACIVDGEDEIYIDVDHIRGFPLFYLYEQGSLFIGDQAYLLKSKIFDPSLEKELVEEYLMTGYVTGNNTIYREIKQLKAGEYLVYNKSSKNIAVKKHFAPDITQKSTITDQDKSIDTLGNILNVIFEELLKGLDGRTVVLPLSGGYDSRLIASYLKKLDYKNVICFTYGNSGNTEAKISKEVANYLGYEWHFIPHPRKEVYNKFNSVLADNYRVFANNLSAIPHIQDWYAVAKLKEDQIIPIDSIFVPGHTALLSFAGLPTANLDMDLVDYIFNKHYTLWDKKSYGDEMINKYKGKIDGEIRGMLNNRNAVNKNTLTDGIYLWEWQERHAKFICNSVRVYEFFDYEWRLPLWDKRLINFWGRTRDENKIAKQLLKDYMGYYYDMPITQANPDKGILTKLMDKLTSRSYLSRYNGNRNILAALSMRVKEVSEHYKDVPFIDGNRLIILTKRNRLGVLRSLNDLLK